MRRILKYIFSILFSIIFLGEVTGQSGRYLPSAVRVGVDPGTLYYMIFSQKRNFFEAEADIDIDRFFLVGNYGTTDYTLEKPTFLYENSGTYFRVGADINFMHEDPHDNVAFWGLRYASASFKDELDYQTDAVIQSETGWPNTMESIENNSLSARWFEMVGGMKIKVVKQLYLGFTVRYKLFMKTSGAQDMKPYYVPGFGKNIKRSSFGFNYYVSYRLPFRKKTVVVDDNKNAAAK
jgi:hypothetical protein